ncbi:hypothetical protein JNB84_03195 [Rhizobium pusense]|uniref:hypothetical protein n=1 Tax=Agrobacterium pusense TaxID=648995 RepID=UPI001C6DD6EE|nr:hypothetical protein [Agrobacterium pusense]MBW9076946.1 hypothetical protein [Agrobacterium pusense]
MAESNKPLVVVLGFHQTFERLPVKGDPLNDDVDAHGFKLDAKGKRVLENTQVDWATYAPVHSPTGTSTSERIRHLKPTEEILEGENGEKTRFMLARWAAIEPAYEAWLKGHELPTNGTPLAIWPGVSAAMAGELKKYNIRTVEEVRDLMEAQLERIRLPNMRALKSQAAAFLENMKSAEAAEREAQRDEEIENLKAALDAQREQFEAAMQLLEERAKGGGADEADAIKAKLDARGIKYHHKAGLATLKALLEDEAA